MEPSAVPLSDRRGAGSRAALLDAARRLFSARGFHGTSVGEIADMAGLRKPSLFHHFPSKEALYRAVVDELFEQLGAATATAAKKTGSYVERLDAIADALTEYLATHPEAARLLFREALEGGTKDGSPTAKALRGAARFLEEGMRAGEFATQDASSLLLSLAGVELTHFAIAPGAQGGRDGAARREAIKAQVRALVLKPKSR